MSVFSELLAQKPEEIEQKKVIQKKVEQKKPVNRPVAEPRKPVVSPPRRGVVDNRMERPTKPVVERVKPIAVPTLRLNLERLARLGMVTPDLENRRVVEEYRYIKRSLLGATFDAQDRIAKGNVIVVTSSHPGEGKTFNALNLALSVAMERDHHVLLIDGDIERAGLSRTLGVGRRPGLSNYLLDDRVRPADTMFKLGGVERLRVLPSGPLRHDASELLASSRMRAFVDEMAARYPDRLVIIDSPPLLSSSSARVLAELAGQVIIIVAAEETSMSALDESLKNVPENKPVRLILNKTAVSEKDGEYRYGYFRKEQ